MKELKVFMDYRRFFARKAEEVAKDLLGRLLLRNTEKGSTSARILEVGAYEEGNETESRAGMQYGPARLFLMPYRGTFLLNIATDKEMYPSCVEIRQVATHEKTVKGSGAVANFFGITQDLDGLLLGDEIQILGEPVDKSQIKKTRGSADNCLGFYSIRKLKGGEAK